MALVMCLAVDRWFAICRPLKYQSAFKRRGVIRNVVLVVFICCVMNSRALFEKRPVVRHNVSSKQRLDLSRQASKHSYIQQLF